MKLEQLLQSQGFGSRKYCQQLILNGAVSIADEICIDPKKTFNSKDLLDLEFKVSNQNYRYYEKVYLALNKPQGYECSHQPDYHHSVFELLPAHLRLRGVQSVGRLDQDTTGLLLFTDDGKFLQKMTHPKKHIGKTYVVDTLDKVPLEMLQTLEQGVELRNEKGVFTATDIQLLAEKRFTMTIHQGVYHQVKRMVASIGHKVEKLHRSKMGQLTLDSLGLEQGQWCYLTAEQLKLLQ